MSHGGDDGLPEEHEEHVNHEAWVIPYADLLTLLMAMFIALFAMSSVDIDKFKELSIGFSEALGGGELSTGVFKEAGGEGPLEGDGSGVAPAPGGAIGPDRQPDTNAMIAKLLTQMEQQSVEASAERETFDEVRDAIEQQVEAAGTGFVGNLEVRLEERGLVVTVVTDQVLFAPGQADVLGGAKPLLTIVSEALKSVDNKVFVEGHTDDVPIDTPQFPSNWELSGARASAVLRFLESNGIDRNRLSIDGYADTHPIADNETTEGRAKNRRVEIVIQSKLVEETLENNNLGTDEVESLDPIDAIVDGGVDTGIAPKLGVE
ncbi:MAG: flagellar motor protein MotB [Actinomycetota bacterium]|nr:flagellar motor protein MotB [Actinomycetota bacterium]